MFIRCRSTEDRSPRGPVTERSCAMLFKRVEHQSSPDEEEVVYNSGVAWVNGKVDSLGLSLLELLCVEYPIPWNNAALTQA